MSANTSDQSVFLEKVEKSICVIEFNTYPSRNAWVEQVRICFHNALLTWDGSWDRPNTSSNFILNTCNSYKIFHSKDHRVGQADTRTEILELIVGLGFICRWQHFTRFHFGQDALSVHESLRFFYFMCFDSTGQQN